MNTPARLLRARIEEAPGPQAFLSHKDLDRRDRILQAGRMVMAEFGRHTITMAGLALGLGISAGSIRRLFPDLDNLMGEIIRLHLRQVCAAVCAVPHDVPDRAAAQRTAYLAATRTGLGAPMEAHLLLLDRRILPPDERASIEAARCNLADILGGAGGMLMLNLLDLPDLSQSQIEAAIAVLAPAAPADCPETQSGADAFVIAIVPPAPTAPETPRPREAPSIRHVPPPPRWRPGPQMPRADLVDTVGRPQGGWRRPDPAPEGSSETTRRQIADEPPGKSLYDRALASLPPGSRN